MRIRVNCNASGQLAMVELGLPEKSYILHLILTRFQPGEQGAIMILFNVSTVCSPHESETVETVRKCTSALFSPG
jgi:hypothetical protein